eukprot:6202484-Pleurochrysis_carterae.AAC.1
MGRADRGPWSSGLHVVSPLALHLRLLLLHLFHHRAVLAIAAHPQGVAMHASHHRREQPLAALRRRHTRLLHTPHCAAAAAHGDGLERGARALRRTLASA